jgi:hypothetical protein
MTYSNDPRAVGVRTRLEGCTILDTLKKFLDVMGKAARASSSRCCVHLALGGTVLALAHTNKHAGIDGKPVLKASATSGTTSTSVHLDASIKEPTAW